MPQIEAFRGVRYDLGHVGSLSDVVAPPYDVIDPRLQDELYQRHPANVVRLILNREEPGDDAAHSRYSRAARFFKHWQKEGVLQQDPNPAIYVYHQRFAYEGQDFTRRGFMARLRLERFGDGRIYPHEETHAAAKEDRLKLMRACHANLSQIFTIFPDPELAVQTLLESHLADEIPLQATDHLGVVHQMWPVTDVKTISELAATMAPKPLYIADGHHRYETACNYRDELASEDKFDSQHPANFVLAMCVGMHDPGMIVLPTHRLFAGVPRLSSHDLTEKLSPAFDLAPAGAGPAAGGGVWQRIQREDRQELIGFYTDQDQRWTLARLNAGGRQRMAELAAEHSSQWQGLGVSLLHRLAVEDLLNIPPATKPTYVHLVSELVAAIQSGQYPLAALVMPATLEHIRTLSEQQERMPAKSTYFYPKLLSGLLINRLD